jgi:heme/copper-type cytochrome/quinol oxidase subunit 1
MNLLLKNYFSFFEKNSSRWLYFTNHKDINTLYLIFGTFVRVIETVFSVIVRLELILTRSSILFFLRLKKEEARI